MIRKSIYEIAAYAPYGRGYMPRFVTTEDGIRHRMFRSSKSTDVWFCSAEAAAAWMQGGAHDNQKRSYVDCIFCLAQGDVSWLPGSGK